MLLIMETRGRNVSKIELKAEELDVFLRRGNVPMASRFVLVS